MVKQCALFVMVWWLSILGQAQTPAAGEVKVWVSLERRTAAAFDPMVYFQPKALERRALHGIPLNDSLCWPLDAPTLELLAPFWKHPPTPLRWFNAIVGWVEESAVPELRALYGVASVHIRGSQGLVPCAMSSPPEVDGEHEFLKRTQLKIMQSDAFEDAGLDGSGVRIAVFDAGFDGVDELEAFAHLFSEGRVVESHDFIQPKKNNVYGHSSHGAHVLSCIAGKDDLGAYGMATGAEFLLYRTERQWLEFKGEEESWLAAMERADRMGADLVNSSLGYTSNRYFQDEMDGRTALVSQAAIIAARRGMLVINAAGNEGNSWWQGIAAPGDVDSVLTVGGVNPYDRQRAGFSSFGPTADGRMKPNVAAFGMAAVADFSGGTVSNGTSFAAPLVTGFAACLKQGHPEWTAMELMENIERSGHLHPYFDYALGFGIPQAKKALGMAASPERTFNVRTFRDVLIVTFADYPVQESDWPMERADLPDRMHVHFQHPGGRLSYYATYEVSPGEEIQLNISGRRGQHVRIYHNGNRYEATVD